MSIPTLVCFLLFLFGVGISLVQLWFQSMNYELFFKVILTDAALFVVSFILAFLLKEKKESDKISDGNSLH